MTLQFFTIVAKGLKLKARKFCGLGTLFVEVTGEKLVGEGRGGGGGSGAFCPRILNRVNEKVFITTYVRLLNPVK